MNAMPAGPATAASPPAVPKAAGAARAAGPCDSKNAPDAADPTDAFSDLLGQLVAPQAGSVPGDPLAAPGGQGADAEAGSGKEEEALAASEGPAPGAAVPVQAAAAALQEIPSLAAGLLAQAAIAAGPVLPGASAGTPAGGTGPAPGSTARSAPPPVAASGGTVAAPAPDAGIPMSAAGIAQPPVFATGVVAASASVAPRADDAAGPATGAGVQMPLPSPSPLPQFAQLMDTHVNPALAGAGPDLYQATMASRPHEPAFGGELAAEVRVMVESGGLKLAELRLNPAELGPVGISLRIHEQTADISFSAAHVATREGIERSLPDLRDMLAGQGLSLGQADVSAGQGQPGGRPRQEAQAPSLHMTEPLRGGAGAAATLMQPARAARGMLDLYA